MLKKLSPLCWVLNFWFKSMLHSQEILKLKKIDLG